LSDLATSLFCPDEKSGRALLGCFNNQFADSLEYLFSVSESHISFDVGRTAALLSRIRAGSREQPMLYSLHFDLVGALQAGDLEFAAGLISKISNQPPAPEGISIFALGLSEIGNQAQTSISYFCEQDSLFTYSRPVAERAERTRSVLSEAIADLKCFAPGLLLRWRP
jgi:hypothetical protein